MNTTRRRITRHPSKRKKVKVLIVDDHPVVREGLCRLINQEIDLKVCGEAEGVHQALEIIEALKPDIAIIDVSLKDTNGIELVKDIRVRYPQLAVLVLSMYDESLYAERALRAGARGYIMKQEVAENVLKAIRKVLDGEIYVSKKINAKMLQSIVDGKSKSTLSPIERLSDRELEVLRLIGQGQGTRQIAKTLCLSIKTIESYRANIKEKMRLKNATELVQHAVGWVQNPTT